MATSRVPAAIDALVSICTNAATVGQATPPIAVYDGPYFTQAPNELILWVGVDDPDSEQAPIGAEVSQQFAGLGPRQRNEQGTIHCVAEAWSGDTNVRTIRVAAFAIVAAVEDLVRADATLGGVLPSGWAEVNNMQLRQNNVEVGAVARVAFHVSYKARI